MATRSTLPSERWFFFALLLIALLPVWASGRFFVTGDGPCHLYNAHVLLDYLLGRNLDFYDPFYNLNLNLNPNWLSHIVLAGLQLIFAPETAEKIFLSSYLLLFGFGLRYLLRQINPDSIFMSSVGLLFVWHHLLVSGFYNFSLSITGFFWIGGYWLKYRKQLTPGRIAILATGWVFLYFTHALGTMFSLVFVGSAILVEALRAFRSVGLRQAWQQHATSTLRTALAALPMLVLLVWYLLRTPPNTGTDSRTIADLLEDLLQLRNLILLNSTERDTVKAVAIFAGLLFAVAAWLRWRERRAAAGDFLLLFVAVALWQYFSPENSRAAGLQIPLRIQTFAWLGMLCWAATANFPEWVRKNAPAAATVLLVVLTFLRFPAHRKASELVEDYLWCIPKVADRSVVLVLNYDFNGLDKAGKAIANSNWLFVHAADYLGAYQPVILSDNYEATKPYFPINWQWQRDMFAQTDKDGVNFENRPPRADILNYKRRSEGYDIDYVLFLSYDPRFYDHDYAREIMGQVKQAYEFVGFSPGGKAELWQRKRE
ncbi:MAG: hypothetical protein IPM98_22500 [Lewinellaceae bacterium]|nr:hypothetical protein [Lewinellaceae bacterium]